MIPATLTLAGLLTGAATVVAEFEELIVLVSALGIGVFVVRFIIGQVRKSRA